MYVQKTVCLVCHAVLSMNLYLAGVMTKYPLKGGVQLWAVPISRGLTVYGKSNFKLTSEESYNTFLAKHFL